ncbi:hypothetical protein [Nostoc sp.]
MAVATTTVEHHASLIIDFHLLWCTQLIVATELWRSQKFLF